MNTLPAPTLIRAHQYLYYVLGTPVLSDYDYDRLCQSLGISGGGGSDLASSYTDKEKDAAKRLLAGQLMRCTR
jgi:NAD-dependent DNA ligase